MRTVRAVGAVVPAAMAAMALAGCTGPSRAEAVLVRVTDEGFEPATLTVTAGTEVRWVNDGSTMKSLTSFPEPGDDGEQWGTTRLLPGETFALGFEEPGTFAYRSGPLAEQDPVVMLSDDPLVGVVEVVAP